MLCAAAFLDVRDAFFLVLALIRQILQLLVPAFCFASTPQGSTPEFHLISSTHASLASY